MSQEQIPWSVIQHTEFAQSETNTKHHTRNKGEKFMKKVMVDCEISVTGNRRQKFKFSMTLHAHKVAVPSVFFNYSSDQRI